MPDEKDRLKDRLKERDQAEEERFFAEESRKQIDKLRAARAAATAAGQGDCPRCGRPLEIQQMRGVAIDACPAGHGIWLEAAELEQITSREGDSWLARLLLGSRR